MIICDMENLPPVLNAVAWYLVFLFSATVHEAAHAWAAFKLGDPTAWRGGQVSLDPIPHIRREPFGMVLLPLISIFLPFQRIPIGFASTPFDPLWADYHPKHAGLMALAGPLANLAILILCTLILWAGILVGSLNPPPHPMPEILAIPAHEGVWNAFAPVLSRLASINLILVALNLIPAPPLDGHAAVCAFLPEIDARRWQRLFAKSHFQWIGILVAWYIFGIIFPKVFLVYLKILYPTVTYMSK